jgi:heat shock protein HslJ
MNVIKNRARILLVTIGIFCFAIPAAFAGTGSDFRSEMANASYQGIEDSSVQLKDGRWEGEPFVEGGASRPAVGLVEDFSLQGDLDGDGADETVVLLWQSSGGSGTFNYMAVMKGEGGALVNVATAPLGDRVQVRGGSIADGVIVLDVVQQGEGDAACCPSQLASRKWTLAEDQLNEQSPDIAGELSVATLEGTEWVLTRLKKDHHLPEGTEVSMEFADGKVAGHSGCNRFSASVENGAAPGEIRIGPAMGTRMACPEEQMNVESEFLDLLGHVSTYRFIAGQLVLTGDKENYMYSLKFSAR